ncbi:DNA-binding transcriptional regulator, IclR family [Microbacterium pygmaeum]|uniref:DNA-binding transcriptional regulator, IclR family n=2 Tax=Microbacterium pygmaeum TaxID=370764 RepID=A0A1G7W918_9MICO|nr:DNA-binding transcriptional regulator, IclR family [Microbacterium pygmaeum]
MVNTYAMQKLPNPTRPQYPIGSVEKALRLLHMLRDHGEVRLRTAATELGTAESTVHRLMAMLVFHGFARQDDSRAYVPGYALGAAPVRSSWTKSLRDIAAPHIEALALRTGETTNLSIRAGTKLRFLWSCEGTKVLRIVNRTGVVMPAIKAAGGRVLLADLPEAAIRRLYQGTIAQAQGDALSDSEIERFLRELRLHHRNGYATANQETEIGVTAVAIPIHDEAGRAFAAVSIAVPSVRYSDLFSQEMMHTLREARAAIELDLHGPPTD